VTTLLIVVAFAAMACVWLTPGSPVLSPGYRTNNPKDWPYPPIRISRKSEMEAWESTLGTSLELSDGLDLASHDLLINPVDQFGQTGQTSRLSNRILFLHDSTMTAGELGHFMYVPKRTHVIYLSKWMLLACELTAFATLLAAILVFNHRATRKTRDINVMHANPD